MLIWVNIISQFYSSDNVVWVVGNGARGSVVHWLLRISWLWWPSISHWLWIPTLHLWWWTLVEINSFFNDHFFVDASMSATVIASTVVITLGHLETADATKN